ncbi:hypothetical protein RI196_09885 [Aeribacillus composti]|uniref:Uncharacterized protein n=1 Tax=Aeribacillus composti TaxID=1868734 RepID=A0ABY9WC25_9BACI|nr:hypothetical protein [Aeribacillus composti]WNF31622.1 hypothetical protein RI196_09885 [Aeribacillus composti]
MGAKNKVIAGDYEGKEVFQSFGSVFIIIGFTKTIELTKDIVEEYEVLDETKRKSVVSAVGRGLVGSFLLGPAGLLAGLSAKSKGVHVVAIKFKDGKKSLLEINDKIYSALMKKLF